MESITNIIDNSLALIVLLFVILIVPILGAEYYGKIVWLVWAVICTIVSISIAKAQKKNDNKTKHNNF